MDGPSSSRPGSSVLLSRRLMLSDVCALPRGRAPRDFLGAFCAIEDPKKLHNIIRVFYYFPSCIARARPFCERRAHTVYVFTYRYLPFATNTTPCAHAYSTYRSSEPSTHATARSTCIRLCHGRITAWSRASHTLTSRLGRGTESCGSPLETCPQGRRSEEGSTQARGTRLPACFYCTC